MVKTKLLLFFLLLGQLTSIAQNIKGNMGLEDSHRPNTSKALTGADIVNCDLYTGIGNVTLPIHNYAIDGINLPIAVSYNTKGIKLDQIASSVGLGWQLNAGGSITRDVNGIEDEVTLPTTYTTAPFNDSLEGYLAPGALIAADSIYPHDDDKEKDLFHINLPGRSIDVAFEYKSGSLHYQTFPKSEIKIEFKTEDFVSGSYTNLRTGIAGGIGVYKDSNILNIIITDEKGNKYYFERGDYRIKEFDFHFWAGSAFTPERGTYYATESWNLIKIETPFGHQITYEYDHTYLEYTEAVTETLYPRGVQWDLWVMDSVTFDPLEIKEVKWRGYKSHIAKINYPNNSTVTFTLNSSPGARCDCKNNFKLNNIIVENKISDSLKNQYKFLFKYSYFHTPGWGHYVIDEDDPCITSVYDSIPSHYNSDSIKNVQLSRGTRLKLKGIERIDGTGNLSEEFFSFEYDATVLPYRFSAHKDYYGYYNGKSTAPYIRDRFYDTSRPRDTFLLSIPYHYEPNPRETYAGQSTTVHTSSWGLDRSHDFIYTKACILRKLKNCSGGEIELVYQDYSLTNPYCSYGTMSVANGSYMGEPIIVNIGCNDIDTALEGENVNDGLILWKVIERDGYNSQNTVTTEYNFSAGERFFRGGYCWRPDAGSNQKIYTNYFVDPHNYVRNSNHGFSEATVSKYGYNSELLSRSKHYFSNLMYEDEFNDTHSWIKKPTGLEWHNMPADMKKYRMGLPLKIEQYDNTTLISSKEYTYEYKSHWLNDIKNVRYLPNYSGFWSYNVIDYDRALVLAITDKWYINSSVAQTKVVEYAHDDKDNIRVKKWTDSKGDVFKKYFLYNYDYNILNYLTVTVPSIYQMHLRGMQYKISEEVWKISGYGMGTDSVLLSIKVDVPTYTSPKFYFSGQFATRFNHPMSLTELAGAVSVGKALLYPSYSEYGTNMFPTSINTKYDDNNNILEQKLNGIESYRSTIHDEKTGQKLAETMSARYDDIAYTSFESIYKPWCPNCTLPQTEHDNSKGNFEFYTTGNSIKHHSATSAGSAMTGINVYDLKTGNFIRSMPLVNNKYFLSFWTTASTPPNVFNTDGSTNTSIACTLRNTVGNWKLYTAIFIPSISGNRLYFFK